MMEIWINEVLDLLRQIMDMENGQIDGREPGQNWQSLQFRALTLFMCLLSRQCVNLWVLMVEPSRLA